MDLRFDVAVRCGDLRAHLLQCLQVQIHGARPDRAPARQRNTRHPHSCHERPQRQDRRAHGLYQLVRRLGMIQLGCFDFVNARRHCCDRHLRIHKRQQFAHGDQVAYPRNISHHHFVRSQQCRGHHRQRRVLCPAYCHASPQCLPAFDQKLIHFSFRVFSSPLATGQRPLVSHQGQPANCPLPLSFSSLPLSPQLPASASPARRAYCVPPPAERAPPQTHFFRLPPPKSATPASQPFHLSVLHQSSGFHKHVQAAPSSRYSAC